MQFGILFYRIFVGVLSFILFHYMWVLVVFFSIFLKSCYYNQNSEHGLYALKNSSVRISAVNYRPDVYITVWSLELPRLA